MQMHGRRFYVDIDSGSRRLSQTGGGALHPHPIRRGGVIGLPCFMMGK